MGICSYIYNVTKMQALCLYYTITYLSRVGTDSHRRECSSSPVPDVSDLLISPSLYLLYINTVEASSISPQFSAVQIQFLIVLLKVK